MRYDAFIIFYTLASYKPKKHVFASHNVFLCTGSSSARMGGILTQNIVKDRIKYVPSPPAFCCFTFAFVTTHILALSVYRARRGRDEKK
jgi:hypothetical protein